MFGIGFHKTGTTTLAGALEFLGYRACHGAEPLRRRFGDDLLMMLLRQRIVAPIFRAADAFDAFSDNPWFQLFREIDEAFPGSRFILTERAEDRWLASAVRYFGRTESALRRWTYGPGNPVGNETLYRDAYRRHNLSVREYFNARPRDLLIVDWEAGDGWTKLCGFLGVEPPITAFPHLQRGGCLTEPERTHSLLPRPQTSAT